LGQMLGGLDDSAEGSTVAAGSPTAAEFDVVGGSFAAGQLIRVGALGDGRAEGQAAIIEAVDGSKLTLATALPAAPSAGDVVYAMLQVHAEEAPGNSALTGWRFLLVTANQQILCHG